MNNLFITRRYSEPLRIKIGKREEKKLLKPILCDRDV